MKAYGYTRRSKLQCRQGCCVRADAGKDMRARDRNDAARRKAARRVTPRLFTDLLDNN